MSQHSRQETEERIKEFRESLNPGSYTHPTMPTTYPV